MQLQQNYTNDKMTSSATQTPTTKSQISEKFVEVKSFYSKHFPTDKKTYDWRIPFVGLALSILFIYFLTTSFAIRYYFKRGDNQLLVYWYIFIAACVNYELHYGLKIGDRKQFTPWILLKAIELIFTIVTIIYRCVDLGPSLAYSYPEIIFGFVILVFNGHVTFVITSKSITQFRGNVRKDNADENIYDTYDDV